MLRRELLLPDPAATEQLGAALARLMRTRSGGLVALRGDLGAGKTSLARACLRHLGVTGAIKSPSYTLVEPYAIQGINVLHMDLYRLTEPEELYGLGVFDEAPPLAWWLVEWPENAGALLPPASLQIDLSHQLSGRLATLQAVDAEFLLTD